MTRRPSADEPDRNERIMQAVLRVLSLEGIGGVSMRAVSREADVALGLVNYHYVDKAGLIAAALQRIGDDDVALLDGRRGETAESTLRRCLRQVARPEFLTTEYLSLRLQLWALAPVDPRFEDINTSAQERYRRRLAELISAARPELSAKEAARRAADIDVVQNGIWLTGLLGLDRASVRRAVTQCEAIALAPG